MTIPVLDNYDIHNINQTYANKPGWKFNPDQAILLIHDMQRYFLDFYTNNGNTVINLIDSIKTLKKTCKQQGIPCAYTVQPGDQSVNERALLADFWGTGLTDDESSTNIVSALKPDENDTIFSKWRYSAFKKNNLQGWLAQQNRNQIVICGVYAHIGILATALEAFMLDYKPFIIGDAVADFSAEDHENALDYIAKRCGVVTNLSSLFSEVGKYPGGSRENKEHSFNQSRIIEDVANILMLDPQSIDVNENLQYLGLDSIRLMNLIENWQSSGLILDFADLAETMTVFSWHKILKHAQEELNEACV